MEKSHPRALEELLIRPTSEYALFSDQSNTLPDFLFHSQLIAGSSIIKDFLGF
jgi:hypothetical protein